MASRMGDEEVFQENRNVLASMSERRDRQHDLAQAIVEISAEPLLLAAGAPITWTKVGAQVE